jgi:hypothetical protein
VRVQACALAAGDVPDPAPGVLAPDPELREVGSQAVEFGGQGVGKPGCAGVVRGRVLPGGVAPMLKLTLGK